MGLDMYAWAVSKEAAGDAVVDYKPKETDTPPVELAYWRKFNHLHGWMEKLYRSKGGAKEEFNCASVRLEAEDLDALEIALADNTLECTPGFFFGGGELYEADVTIAQDFIADARLQLKASMAVFYDSWW